MGKKTPTIALVPKIKYLETLDNDEMTIMSSGGIINKPKPDFIQASIINTTSPGKQRRFEQHQEIFEKQQF